jgi:hypothetical protein
MTAEQLLDVPVTQLEAMSDAELAAFLSPMFPQARAPYVGKKQARTDEVLMPNGRRVSLKQSKDENALIAQTLRSLGIKT